MWQCECIAMAQVVEQLEARWDGAEAMRKLAAGSVATETGGVDSLLKTNDALTSQLALMTSQIQSIMLCDTEDSAAAAQMASPLYSP